MRKSLTRQERLRGRTAIRRVFSAGKSAERRGIKLLFVENSLSWNRIAVCPVRGFKSAVDRNRAKRLCREAYRDLKGRIATGYDLAFVLYPGRLSFADCRRQVESLLERAGLNQ